MSFWKSLFGGKAAAEAAPAPSQSIEYQGFVIRAEPFESGGQYQTAGTIEKEIDGVRQEHRFIRADRHAALDMAIEFTLAKGRLIVDQLGERIFR
jgi:hypothetical protein